MQKSYYAIIPANVRYDKDIPPNAKLLYGEITALCNEKGYCWASNSYFSELYGVNKVTISRWISQLIEKGYILSEMQYKEGTKQIVNRYLQICNGPINEIVNTPINKNAKENITSINTTSNNTKEIYIPFSEIITYLNEKTQSNYKASSNKTKDLITARWNQGFTLDDFKTVIDKKSSEWLNNDMSKYLRPETLFGTKFEAYLNQKVGVSSGKNQHAQQLAAEYNLGF